MSGDAVARTTEQCELGEGARWDARRSELLRVDILAGRIYRDKIIEDGVMLPVQTYHVPGTVGRLPLWQTMRAGCSQLNRASATFARTASYGRWLTWHRR